MSLKHFIELIILAAIWGASFLCTRIAVPEFGPVNTAALRVLIGALTLSPLLFWLGRKYLSSNTVTPTLWRHLTIVGLGNSLIPYIMFAYAAIYIEAGLASVINSATPLWAAIFSILILSQSLSRQAWLGIAIGFVGSIILSSHKLEPKLNSDVLSILSVMGATCLYGATTNYSKRFLTNISPIIIAASTTGIAGLCSLLVLFSTNKPIIDASLNAWLAVISLGALATGLAFILFYRLVDNVGPTQAVMVTYLIPIFGVLFGHVFLNEHLYMNMLLGGALTLFGVMLTTGLFKQRHLKKTPTN